MDKDFWQKKKMDPAYLLESGLLFEINRTILHPIGLALMVKKDEAGNSSFGLKDNRDTPSNSLYSKENFKAGHKRLRKFMTVFGHQQLKQRAKKLGWSFQSMHVIEEKRYSDG